MSFKPLNFIWKYVMSTITYKNIGIALLVLILSMLGLAGVSASKYTFATQAYVDEKVNQVESRLDNKIDCMGATLTRTILVEKLLDLENTPEAAGENIVVRQLRIILNDDLNKAEKTLKGCK